MFLNFSNYSGSNPGANLQKKELPLSPVNPISPERIKFPGFLFKMQISHRGSILIFEPTPKSQLLQNPL